MQEPFYAEAEKHNVLPLDNSIPTRVLAPRPGTAAGRATFSYSGEISVISCGSAPSILQPSYKNTAEVTIPPGGAEGMIVPEAGRFGGFGFFLSNGVAGIRHGKPVFLYNLFGLERTVWPGPELAAGRHALAFEFASDGGGFGKGGTDTLRADGKAVDSKRLAHTVPLSFHRDETFDVGLGTEAPVTLVDFHFAVPFRFTGILNKVTFDLQPQQMIAAEQAETAVKARRNNRASQ